MTKNGRRAVVLLGADDYDTLLETLDILADVDLVSQIAQADNPHRVGKQLNPPLWPKYSARRGEFRIIYTIIEREVVVEVVTIQHRRDVHRTL